MSANAGLRKVTPRSDSLTTLKGLLSPTGRKGSGAGSVAQQRLTGKQPGKSVLKKRPEVTEETFSRQPEMSERRNENAEPGDIGRLSLQGESDGAGREEGKKGKVEEEDRMN